MARLSGHAVVWDAESHNLGGFREVFRRGAFARTLADSGDVFFLHSHRSDYLIGSVEAGTMTLAEDERGLAFSIETPDTTTGRDVAELVAKRILRGMSFGFIIPTAAGERWSEGAGGLLRREVIEADLIEVSSTQWPAYPASYIEPAGKAATASGGAIRKITANDRRRLAAKRRQADQAQRRAGRQSYG